MSKISSTSYSSFYDSHLVLIRHNHIRNYQYIHLIWHVYLHTKLIYAKELGIIRHWDLYTKPDALIGLIKKSQNVAFSIIW